MIKSFITSSNINRSYLLTVLLVSQAAVQAQKMTFLNKPSYNSPLFVCIVSEKFYNEFLEEAKQNHFVSNNSFLVINGNAVTANEIRDRVNGILNSDTLLVSKNNVYLGIIGNGSFLLKYDVYTNDFFPAQFYLGTEDDIVYKENFKAFRYKSIPLSNVLELMKESYLWDIDRLGIQQQYRSDYHLSKIERGIGVGLSLYNPNTIRYDAFDPSNFITYGITGYRRINRDWKIYGNLFMNFKIPNMEKVMQEEMQSQMDISSMSSGDDVTIHINTDIQVRMYLNANLEARRYLLLENSKIKPFVGAGLSYGFLMNMNGAFDTTLTLDPSSMMSGGGISSGGGGFSTIDEANNENMNSINTKSLGMLISTGFEYPLNDYALFNAKLAYHLPANTFNQSIATVNGLDFQIGLVFKLNGKKIKFVEYMRTK